MALPATFDAIFNRHRNRVPLNFMKALTKRESNFNPRESNDPAWGLMQVVPVVREGYNQRFGTSYTKNDLLDPDVNVKIVSELLNRIASAYSKNGDPNMKENWANPEFVKLLTAGWNSGYSEAGGVGKVASYLESRGIPVTHDNVFRYASAAGATKHLSNSAKQAWQRSVSDLYFAEGGPGLLSGFAGKLILTVLVSWGVYKLLT